jgi:hypothetical protein
MQLRTGVLRAQRVFILEQHFASEMFTAVREAFSKVYPDKEVLTKTTIHRMVTKFRDKISVCLWQVLIELQNSWNNPHANISKHIREDYKFVVHVLSNKHSYGPVDRTMTKTDHAMYEWIVKKSFTSTQINGKVV